MAYKKLNLSPIANNGKTNVVPAIWSYWNEDGDTMTTAGAIKELAMSVGDQVLVIASDKATNAWHHVTAKAADGSITLVANS